MKTITLTKKDPVLSGKIHLPSSKSISNRLLILKELAEEPFTIHNLSRSDDTLLLEDLLAKINAHTGGDGMTELDTRNAGSVMRFLTAYLSFIPGKWILTGTPRMRERPIGILVDALKPLGAQIEYLGQLGFPPIMIKGRPLKGGEIIVDPGISSQFVSALILIAPRLPKGLTLHLQGTAVSVPYIEMTIRLLRDLGVPVVREKSWIRIPESRIIPKEFTVETDWSSASFWYEAASFSKSCDLVLPGLVKESLQGDSIISSVYRNFGISTEFIEEGIRLSGPGEMCTDFSFDFSDYPDIAMPVITTCAILGIHGKFDGLKGLRIKETDRLNALGIELGKMGVTMETDHTGDHIRRIEIAPTSLKDATRIRIATYGDHRIAMTFAALSILTGSIIIEDPDVVSKSYPDYWNDMLSLGFEIEE